MLASIYAKLAGLALIALLLLGLFLWGDHHGAAKVQARWDAANAAQDVAVSNRKATNAAQTLDWLTQFQAINSHYESATHETLPTVADPLAVAVAAGTVGLRDEAPASRCPGTVSVAASRSHAADAAATQALADRVANSIAAVRAGDAADKREHDLDQQIIALQAILMAERQPSPAQ